MEIEEVLTGAGTPWVLHVSRTMGHVQSNGNYIFSVPLKTPEDRSRAALILAAVNAYEGQRAALREMLRAVTELNECINNGSPTSVLRKAQVFAASTAARAKELLP